MFSVLEPLIKDLVFDFVEIAKNNKESRIRLSLFDIKNSLINCKNINQVDSLINQVEFKDILSNKGKSRFKFKDINKFKNGDLFLKTVSKVIVPGNKNLGYDSLFFVVLFLINVCDKNLADVNKDKLTGILNSIVLYDEVKYF